MNNEKNKAKYRKKRARKTVNVITAAFALPPLNSTKGKKKKPLAVGFRAMVAHVPLTSRTGTLPHDLRFHFCIRGQLYQCGCPPPSRLEHWSIYSF